MLSIPQQEREYALKNCLKLKLRDAGLKMALGVSALQYMATTQDPEVIAKCKLIYWRLLDIIFKLDSIDG